MAESNFDTVLTKTEPEKNTYRYYAVSIQLNLFGGYSVIRNWGRIGSNGRSVIDLFDDVVVAAQARDRLVTSKLARGYIADL